MGEARPPQSGRTGKTGLGGGGFPSALHRPDPESLDRGHPHPRWGQPPFLLGREGSGEGEAVRENPLPPLRAPALRGLRFLAQSAFLPPPSLFLAGLLSSAPRTSPPSLQWLLSLPMHPLPSPTSHPISAHLPDQYPLPHQCPSPSVFPSPSVSPPLNQYYLPPSVPLPRSIPIPSPIGAPS